MSSGSAQNPSSETTIHHPVPLSGTANLQTRANQSRIALPPNQTHHQTIPTPLVAPATPTRKPLPKPSANAALPIPISPITYPTTSPSTTPNSTRRNPMSSPSNSASATPARPAPAAKASDLGLGLNVAPRSLARQLCLSFGGTGIPAGQPSRPSTPRAAPFSS